jgi:hypothetical protein
MKIGAAQDRLRTRRRSCEYEVFKEPLANPSNTFRRREIGTHLEKAAWKGGRWQECPPYGLGSNWKLFSRQRTGGKLLERLTAKKDLHAIGVDDN